MADIPAYRSVQSESIQRSAHTGQLHNVSLILTRLAVFSGTQGYIRQSQRRGGSRWRCSVMKWWGDKHTAGYLYWWNNSSRTRKDESQAGAGTDPSSASQEVPVDTLQLSPFNLNGSSFGSFKQLSSTHNGITNRQNPSKMLHLQFKTSYKMLLSYKYEISRNDIVKFCGQKFIFQGKN